MRRDRATGDDTLDSADTLIHVRDLAVDYGSLRAVDIPDLRLGHGAIGLLGPNGAGKSTLLKVILGLLRPSRGSGQVLGLDLFGDHLEIRSRVGYMPENDNLVPGLNAVEFTVLAGGLAGMVSSDAIRRAHEVLSYLRVEEVRYRRLEEYSAGTRQRLKLAQALVHDPELLILDEPTNGLDPTARRRMLDLVRRLHVEHGKSFLLSTHLLEDVDRICDVVLIMQGGRILTCGRIDQLRSHWKNRYRIRFAGDASILMADLSARGLRIHERLDGAASGAEYVVELPSRSDLRTLFRLLAGRVEQGGEPPPEGQRPAATLRSFRPEREGLDRLFRRVVEGGGSPDGLLETRAIPGSGEGS